MSHLKTDSLTLNAENTKTSTLSQNLIWSLNKSMIKRKRVKKLIEKLENVSSFNMYNLEQCLVGRAWKWFRKESFPRENYYYYDGDKMIQWFAKYFGIDSDTVETVCHSVNASKQDIISYLKLISGQLQ